MIIWFVFMLFHCFGRRAPTSEMGTVAAVAGAAELVLVDILITMRLIS